MSTVPFQPKAYHTITPYLYIRGAAQAIEFYKNAFDAREEMRMNQPDGKVGHAEITIGDSRIMMADEFPDMGVLSPESVGGSSVSLVLYVQNCDATVEKAVAAGAIVTRPLEDKFYGDRAGTIKDPFGHVWHIMTHIKDMTEEEMMKAAEAMER
jgi:PhnB protein